MPPLELYPPRFRLTPTAIPGQLLTADQYGIGTWQDPPEGTIPPVTGGAAGDYPRLATIYSKTDENDEAGKLAIAKFQWYVTDFGWWPDTGWSGGSGPLGISVGAFIKLNQPVGAVNTIYWHSCIYEWNQAIPLVGNYWRASETGYYVGGVRYRQCLEWLLCYRGSTLSSGINSTTTSIPVAQLSYFDVNDHAIIALPGDSEGMEMVTITAKSAASGAGTLTVVRGEQAQNTNLAGSVGGGYPAVAHSSGKAIRSVAYAFGNPDYMMVNVTATCPTANGGFGTQTYSQWQASWLAMKLAEPNFTNLDGVFLDNFIEVPATIFDGTRGVSTVDGSNTNAATGVSDAVWKAGMVDNAAKLRTAMGSTAIVTGNTGGAAADFSASLQGGMIEGFDEDGTNDRWRRQPTARVSVLSQLERGHEPVLHHERHEPRRRPDQADQLSGDALSAWVGPSSETGTFVTTKSESTTSNSSHQTEWWYDEYDDVGAGVGWLGQPTGPYTTISAGVYRRKFDNGVVVVNTTGSTVTDIALGGTYRRLSGSAGRDGERRRDRADHADLACLRFQDSEGLVTYLAVDSTAHLSTASDIPQL
jgi:hypothetical protein